MKFKDGCLDPQILAAFAERNVKRSELPAILEHLDQCPACMSAVQAAIDLGDRRRQAMRPWLAVAAAVAAAVVIVAGVPFARRWLQTTPTERLVELAPRSARTIEPRLSGGFGWAPYRGPMRATDGASEAERMKLIGAAGELVERAEKEKSADAQHAAGVGLVLIEKPEDAMGRLREAASQRPDDARAWSDLAAAEYTAALRLGRSSLYPVALASADRALRADPNFAEALFNRALILERLGLAKAAREAWERYLRVDSASLWATEARERMQRLADSTAQSLFQRDEPRLLRAVAAGDRAAVQAIVDRHRQHSRAWTEVETLGRWGEAVQRGDPDVAARELAAARAIGNALHHLSGESLLRDAVAIIDITPEQRAALAEAHVAYRRARLAYSRGQPAAAEPELRRASELFARARDPMSLVARYFAACTRFDQNDLPTARRELESLRSEADPRYIALHAQIHWELALCAFLDDDWSATAALASEAARRFEQLGEKGNLAFMQTMLATALISLGRPDDGWELRRKAFAIQSAEGRPDRLLVSVTDAGWIELRTGRPDSAQALLAVEESAHRAAGDDVQLSNALVRNTLIALQLGSLCTSRHPESAKRGEGSRDAKTSAISRSFAVFAAQDDGSCDLCRGFLGEANEGRAAEAMSAAMRIPDPALRARAVADAQLAAGAEAVERDAARAHELLSQAIAHYGATASPLYLPDARLFRARASLRLGRGDDALRDLREGIDEVERHRPVVVGRVAGGGVLEARRALYEELVTLQLDRGDVAGAFAAADRARERLSLGRDAASVAALQAKLNGSDAAVLALTVLPRELIVFWVTASDVTVARRTVRREALGSLNAQELYELLVRSSEETLRNAGQLIVIADPALQGVSFAALYDATSKRHLVETLPVSMALSASALQATPRANAAPSVATIVLPSGEETATVALADADAELADVERLYGKAMEIDASLSALAASARSVDVIHIAGHTGRQAGAGDAALLFRGEPATWSRVAALQLGHPIVVLAACETLRAPASGRAHAMSLGGGFLAAGASAVIGTLSPVADNEAREIFRSVHRQLARGAGAAAALRQAQLEAIAEESRGRRTGWRSVAVLTNTIESN